MSVSETLQSFTLETIPDLDTVVMGAIELLAHTKLPETKVPYKRPLVVGSGNAEATGRILFAETDAVFASESNYEEALKRVPEIDGAVIISASGGKHAVGIAKSLKKHGIKTTLFTNNPSAGAAEYLEERSVRVFPKNREPYTYNTSTYLSMIMAETGEKAGKIKTFIDKELSSGDNNKDFSNFKNYHAFTFILPAEFAELRPMLRTKFDELFGTKVVGRFFTPEEIKHAKTVVPDDRELFISIGSASTENGNASNHLRIPLPEGSGYGSALAVTYYLVGLIQRSRPPYFKDHIEEYCRHASKIFNQPIKPIVD